MRNNKKKRIQQQHGFTCVCNVQFTIVHFFLLIDHSSLLFLAHAFPLSPDRLHVLNLALPLSLIFVGYFQVFSYICREYII